MRPLDDPVVLAYAAGTSVLLLAAALTLGVLRFACARPVEGAWRTFRGWLLIVPAVLLAVVAGDRAVVVGVAALSIAAVREFAIATGLGRNWPMIGVVFLGVLALAAVTLSPDPRLGVPGWYGMFMALPAFTVCALMAVPVIRDRARGQIQAISLSILAYIYFGWMLGHLGFLVHAESAANHGFGRGLLLYVLMAVSLTDVASYVAGRTWGGRVAWSRVFWSQRRGRRLAPRVSPGKTVAGALGGFAVAMTLPWVFAFSLPGFGTAEKLLAGVIVGVGAPLGDLALSVVKRDLGIKDMGSALAGHGGVLDRIDSLIFVAPLFFHMVRWWHGIRIEAAA